MLPSLTLEVDQRGRMVAELESLAQRYENWRPLAYSIATLLRASFGKNFDAGGRPRWAPLSKNTLAAKALRGESPQPLIGTRLLRNAATRRGARGNVTYVTSDGHIRVGVNLAVGAWLQNGTRPYLIVPHRGKTLKFQTAGGKVFAKEVHHPGLVPRPFIVVQPEDWDDIRDLLRDFGQGKLVERDE